MPKKTKAKGNTKKKSVKGQKVNKNKRDKSKKDPNHVHESKVRWVSSICVTKLT